MGFNSIFQASFFIKHLQKCAVVEKMGRVKKSTGGCSWAFDERGHGQASSQATVALGRDFCICRPRSA